MNLLLKISMITLISIIAANTVFSYAIAFPGDSQLPGVGTFEDCGNGVDDDGDGLVDGAGYLDC